LESLRDIIPFGVKRARPSGTDALASLLVFRGFLLSVGMSLVAPAPPRPYLCSVAVPPEYNKWLKKAQAIFTQKRQQYGESWRALSFPSLIDLLLIKAHRLRTLYQQNRQDKPATGENPIEDWLSLVNYGAIALASLEKNPEISVEELVKQNLELAQHTLERKNADYGDAWRLMRPLAFAEFILMKLERLRQMDHDLYTHHGAIRDNLIDIINYAILFLCQYGNEVRTA